MSVDDGAAKGPLVSLRRITSALQQFQLAAPVSILTLGLPRLAQRVHFADNLLRILADQQARLGFFSNRFFALSLQRLQLRQALVVYRKIGIDLIHLLILSQSEIVTPRKQEGPAGK